MQDIRLCGSERERYQALVMGSKGSGKSTARKDLLRQLRRRDQCTIIYDVSVEYVSAFSGRVSVASSIRAIREAKDGRFVRRPKTKKTDPSLAQRLYRAIGREPFWATGAAVLFAANSEALSAAEGCDGDTFASCFAEILGESKKGPIIANDPWQGFRVLPAWIQDFLRKVSGFEPKDPASAASGSRNKKEATESLVVMNEDFAAIVDATDRESLDMFLARTARFLK